jgi:hypothetical protein
MFLLSILLAIFLQEKSAAKPRGWLEFKGGSHWSSGRQTSLGKARPLVGRAASLKLAVYEPAKFPAVFL